jgi:hypothetical protein
MTKTYAAAINLESVTFRFALIQDLSGETNPDTLRVSIKIHVTNTTF